MNFLQEIERQGLDSRFALDIASVKSGIRQRGLLHVHASRAEGVRSLLTSYGLKLTGERLLESNQDSQSREGVLTDLKADTPLDRLWHEIWFSSQGAPPVEPQELFRAPGVHLSYPNCCIDAMLSTRTLSSFYDVYINAPEHRAWEINRLTTVFSEGLLTPDFFPCSLACKKARDFAEPFIKLSVEVFGQHKAADWIRRAKQPYFVYNHALYTASDYTIDDNHLVVETESMSAVPLQKIGATISQQGRALALIPFAHFYNFPSQELRITLTKDGHPISHSNSPPYFRPEF